MRVEGAATSAHAFNKLRDIAPTAFISLIAAIVCSA
jgi:hypothetical protein